MKILIVISFLFILGINISFGSIEVNVEHIEKGWKFNKVISPSKSDAAFTSVISFAGNKPLSSCLSPNGLHNGVLPQENRLLRDFFCFSNDNANGGKIIMDLGKVIPVAMINSYSAHGPVGGTTWCNEFDGSCGPQVYTLYASASEKPDFGNLKGNEWTKITDVDTRPTVDGENWQGTYGVNIKNKDGSLLGNFRWIVWDVKPTFKKGTKPEWTDTWYCELDVHTPETVKNAGDAIMAGTQLKEIILAFKSHFDIGFTHPAPEIVGNYRTTMIDNALKLIEESYKLPPEKRFVWTIPSWVAYQILWSGQDSVRKARVLKAMKKGSLIVHALPVTVQTESLETEDLVFGLLLNKKVSEMAGVPLSRSGKMTDVPSHSWIWPTLLKNAGIDFLHIGVNPTNERPDVPLLYYWQGPDGSKLLTMQTQGYGSDCEFGHGLYPPKDWPYKTWLALIVAVDNGGPPTKQEFERLINEAARNEPGVKIRSGKMEDFADAIFAEEKQGAKVPVIRADMPDCWIHGMGTMPVEESIAHKTRKEISSVEMLDAHLCWWGLSRPNISKDLFIAHERSLMYGEHTWGGARNLQGKNVFGITHFEEFILKDKDCQWLEKTWKDHADYIHKSAEIIDSLARPEMSQLVGNVAIEGRRMVVYNSLPWERDALVEIPNSKGRMILVKNIPSCGYKTISLKDNTDNENIENKEEAVLENKFLKIKVNRKSGGIVSIVEKKNGMELVDSQSKYAFGQYFYQRFDSAQNHEYHTGCVHLNTVYGSNDRSCWGWNTRADLPSSPSYQSAVPEFQSMKLRHTSTSTDVLLYAKAGGIIQSDVTTVISLPNELPWFEIKVQLDNKKPDYWTESGSIYLPVNADKPQFRIGRLGKMSNPAEDFVRGSNRTYGYVNTGAMIANSDGKGLAICPLDHGIMSFGDKGICTIDPDYIPEKPIALISMFNNIWTINFPYWIKGSLSSRVRIWATDNLNDSSLVVGATEARNPVMIGYADGQGGKLPAEQKGIEVSGKNVQVFVKYSTEGTTITCWELCGEADKVSLTLPKGLKISQAIPVNLRGEMTGNPLPVKDGRIQFNLDAYAPASFILK